MEANQGKGRRVGTMWPMTLLRIILIVFMGIWLYHTLLILDGKRESMRLKIRKRVKVTTPKRIDKMSRNIYYALFTLLIIVCFLLIKIKVRGALW